jgi:peptide deformylase
VSGTRIGAGPYNHGMAILKVARLGHPVLRQKAAPVPTEKIASREIQQLIDDMFETMHEYGGIGLAAPQVHESLRLFVAGIRDADVVSPMSDDEDMPLIAVINPEVVPVSRETATDWEGCLSIPDIRGQVPRPSAVRLRALDRHGEKFEVIAKGLPARVIQHETDHLDGIIFFDRMKSLESLAFMDEYRRYWAGGEE